MCTCALLISANVPVHCVYHTWLLLYMSIQQVSTALGVRQLLADCVGRHLHDITGTIYHSYCKDFGYTYYCGHLR
jgi:hypothetical protein